MLLDEAVLKISPMSYKPTGMIVFCPIEIKLESKRESWTAHHFAATH